MKGPSSAATSVDAYISGFPKGTQAMLKELRETILKAAPDAEEGISYRMPAYKLNGPLVYFAGYERHVGFYPGSSGVSVFQKELDQYNFSKGTIQIPLDKKIPVSLITRIVKHRAQENLTKQAMRTEKKTGIRKPAAKAKSAVLTVAGKKKSTR